MAGYSIRRSQTTKWRVQNILCYDMIVNWIFKAAQDAPPQWGPRYEGWFLVLHPLVFEQLPPNQHVRLTAVGLRTCEAGTTLALLSLASGVTDKQVAEGQATTEGRSAA